MSYAAAIFGLAGPALSSHERAFFKAADPWGFILFQRNCVSRTQVRALTEELKSLSGRAELAILIDEEGGRVQRLKPPEWRVRPPMRAFGSLYEIDPDRGQEAVRLNARLIAEDLVELGATVDCVPCLDVPVPGAHAIIGDRAFGSDPTLVSVLGRAVCETILDSGVLPVVKHIPGHGRANLDTHEALPRVSASRAELSRTDFAPFRALRDQALAMTAHVVFESVDTEVCATLSAKVIAEVIRGEIGFDGLLMSDDLNMKALEGSLGERAAKAIKAGCDVALHCSGILAEMEEIAGSVPRLAGKAKVRAEAAMSLLKRPRHAVKLAETERRLKELMA